MEREAIFDYVTHSPREIPSQPMVGVKNPFLLKMKTADQNKSLRTGTALSFFTYRAINSTWELLTVKE